MTNDPRYVCPFIYARWFTFFIPDLLRAVRSMQLVGLCTAAMTCMQLHVGKATLKRLPALKT